MSAEKCGGVLTFDMVQRATEIAAQRGMEPYQRVISYRAHSILKRIQQKEPGWDRWTVEGEIYHKAYKMGLLEEE